MTQTYLPNGLPVPTCGPANPTAPFWTGLRNSVLRIQKCRCCHTWQWGPEFICHRCHSFDVEWREVQPRGRIYSWTRVWQAAQPTLKDAIPYIVVLVELDVASHVRLIGNLLGEPNQIVEIGAQVVGVYERSGQQPDPGALLQWSLE